MHQFTTLIFIFATASLTLAQIDLPNFDWNCEKSLATCNNACYAVHCRGKGAPFTYDGDLSHRAPRRRDSGCSRSPCTQGNLPYSSFGNSCDEFPFASTFQGGSGAILRCVDSTENSSEGGQLSAFYNKLKSGDQFDIYLSNYIGAPFCENNQLCDNDGGEFELVGGNFQNAKRSRIMPRDDGFVSSEAEDKPRSAFRKFLGDDGGERLYLGNGNDAVIGMQVWDGDEGHSKVTLVEELFD